MHKGIDVFARRGTRVNSATIGIVLLTAEYGKGGKFVVVLGPKWRLHYYAHLDEIKTAEYKLFKVFASKMQLNPYRTEWSVYDWEHKIAGTIDFVDYQNGEYVIYDWKRSDKIVENGMPVKANKYGEKGKNPLEHLDNTPYYHYALQLSLYKYILEKNYGLKIADLRLGIFHPTYNKPYVLRMPYLEKEVNDIIALRSEILF